MTPAPTPPTLPFLQAGPPSNDPEVVRNFIAGLWLTDEVTEVMIRAAHDGDRYEDLSRLQERYYEDGANGHRLAVWVGRKFDGPVFHTEHAFVRLRTPFHSHGDLESGEMSACFRPYVDTNMYRLASKILERREATKHTKGSYMEDLPTITAFTALAGYFEPAPFYKQYLERFAHPIHYPELTP